MAMKANSVVFINANTVAINKNNNHHFH